MILKYRPAWKKGDVIRNILTGKPLLVIHIYNFGINTTATVTVDIESKSDPTPVNILLQRDYDHWVRDVEMDIKGDKWEYSPLPDL